MDYKQMEQAALNNALWCDGLCRSHGKPGEFLEGLWLNRHAVPRFYSNAVTLAGGETAVQIAQIEALLGAGLPGGWTVKDSFDALDLAPLGFRELFKAEWIYRAAALPEPATASDGVHWERISDASGLAVWEEAWGGLPEGDVLSRPPRIFLPALLMDESIAIVAAYRGEQIVAGAIANHTGEVVGLSNVFALEDADRFWAGCIARAMDAFPGLPLVGYERDQALETACALGFERIGALRVWLHDTQERP